MTSNGNGNTLKYRVGRLETNYEKLDGKIDTILTNHLPHIQKEMLEMKTGMNVLTALNVGAIIAGVLASKIL